MIFPINIKKAPGTVKGRVNGRAGRGGPEKKK